MPLIAKPELSFHGTLHWQLPDGRPELHGLSATYVEQAPTALDNGWIYASVGDSYSGLKPVALGLDHVAARLVGLVFRFDCFYSDDPNDLGYHYSLRVDNPHPNNPFQHYVLDVSRHGYLGLYSGQGDAGPLWRFKGLDPCEVVKGSAQTGLTLISPNGHDVRRRVEDAYPFFPYLSDVSGDAAQFALKLKARC